MLLGPIAEPADNSTIVERLDTITAKLATTPITVTAPVLASGDISLVRGDDYHDARALTWTLPEGLDLAGASISLAIHSRATASLLLQASASVADEKVRCELTSAQTGSLPEPPPKVARVVHRYAIKATLANGDSVTLARGTVTVWH